MYTVAGPIETSELGFTLMHEHVVVSSNVMRLTWPDAIDEDRLFTAATTRLHDAHRSGVNSVVDMTTADMGRDAALLQRVAAAVPVNIVATTGLWKFPPHQFEIMDTRAAAALFVREATVGIQGTDVKAGIIKLTSQGADLTAIETAILRACAVAHFETGLPIFTHTNPAARGGLAQQEAFTRAGVDLTRVVIGHCSTTDMAYLQQLVDRGSFISVDKFGFGSPFPSTDEQVDAVAKLCAQGYARQLVLSHDTAGFAAEWTSEDVTAKPDSRFSYIASDVLPRLRAAGVSEEQIRVMTRDNPKAVFDASGR